MSLTNFQIVSMKDFLYRDTYFIPPYQRGYSWEETQLEDFWLDLIQLLESDQNEEHFLGQIVIHEDIEEKKKFIIDGQQRVTTAVILLDVLRTEANLLYKQNNNMDLKFLEEDITSQLIGRVSESKRELKLYLGKSDEEFFYKYIQRFREDRLNYEVLMSEKEKEHFTPSNLNILNANRYFSKKVEKYLATDRDPIGKIINLSENFKKNFKLVYLETNDINEAYIIFETLNARGKELETADLLKNHILRSVDGHDVDKIHEKWLKMIEILDDKDPSKFIRYYWNSQNNHIREKDLYKALKNKTKTPRQVRELLDTLVGLSEVFVALQAPEDNKFFEYDILNERILEISRLKASTFYPIILAMYSKKYTDEEIDQVLQSIESLIVRNFIVAGKTANKYEKDFSMLALEITEGILSNVEDIRKKISSITIKDAEFMNNFEIFSSKKNDVIRYLLRKIHKYNNVETSILDNSKKIHVEHILPKKYSEEEWPQFIKEEADEYLWRLGNLTLLGQEYNQKASNKAFSKKKEIYSKSTIGITSMLSDISVWTPNQIEDRQKAFARLAIDIWPLF